MNCDQLQTFQAVAMTGSFTKAARQLLLTQSAVSQQIQTLEAALGVRLFDREGKKIHLTREGEILLSRARRVTVELREIKSLFEDLSNLERGRMDIGSSAIFGTHFLPRPIGAFNKSHPGVEIRLHSGNSHEIISMLLNDEIEFGFGGLFEDEQNIDFIMIHTEPLIAVAGKHHPLAHKKKVTAEHLKTVPLILREKGTRIRRNMEAWFAAVAGSFSPGTIIELENAETAKKMIEEGYGITILPKTAVRRELKAGTLKKIDLPKLNLNAAYYLYYPRFRKFSRAAKTFLRLLPETTRLSHGDSLEMLSL